MSLSVTSTLVTHWKYLNEGGASLVLAYTGPSDIRFDNSILRLRKSPIHPSTPHQPIPTPADDPTVVFQAHVISPLLNSRYLPTLHIVALGPLWLSELARSIHDLRPKTRSDADQIDLTRASGVLATNVIGTTGIAVEIKVLPSLTLPVIPSIYPINYSPSGVSFQTLLFFPQKRAITNPRIVAIVCTLS